MTAGIEDDPQIAWRAITDSMAVSTTTAACLTDEKWERATHPENGDRTTGTG